MSISLIKQIIKPFIFMGLSFIVKLVISSDIINKKYRQTLLSKFVGIAYYFDFNWFKKSLLIKDTKCIPGERSEPCISVGQSKLACLPAKIKKNSPFLKAGF